ncbi:MAG: GNAT family N-acetyltransferase [Phycisphaerae bacterium]|nr:GNAT family N-acetyltransferase [Phycisphaerae bacterium]
MSTLLAPEPRHLDKEQVVCTTSRCRIRLATRDDLSVLADIHAAGMPRDFLVRLGRTFQTKVLFPTMLAASGTCLYVAQEGGKVRGFLVTRLGFGGVISEVLAHHPVWMLVSCVAAALRHPSLLRDAVSVLAQVRKRGAEPEVPASAELFLMAVDPRARRRGVGRALVEHSVTQLRAGGITTYRVLPHADNKSAKRFYEDTGFTETGIYHFAGQPWRRLEMEIKGR